ncbi:MAG: hypothetical protein JXP73_19290 [Deltaproteobacteria bacterium]|nr:hypothetical protein [Deltaproteobacteria bacterium]
MTDARAHHDRYQYMRGLYDAYPPALPAHRDWEIVVGFYAALHLVQAYFCTKSLRFQAARHEDRIAAIRRSPELNKSHQFVVAYKTLQDVSEQVRYDPGFKVADTHLQTAKENLETVERMLQAKVNRVLAAHHSP